MSDLSHTHSRFADVNSNLERIKLQETRVSEIMDEDNQHLFAFWTCVDLER